MVEKLASGFKVRVYSAICVSLATNSFRFVAPSLVGRTKHLIEQNMFRPCDPRLFFKQKKTKHHTGKPLEKSQFYVESVVARRYDQTTCSN